MEKRPMIDLVNAWEGCDPQWKSRLVRMLDAWADLQGEGGNSEFCRAFGSARDLLVALGGGDFDVWWHHKEDA